MKPVQWIGAAVHLLLGLVFPYVLGGTVVLTYGLMSPSTAKQKLAGALIAIVYVAMITAVNVMVLKYLPRKSKINSAVIHAALFAAGAAVMFAALRR
ncbi:hypothetical protein [Paenibacillus humicola]|uniref:hypothetical protein n=1 Tax=Paenibacillus humicola TaxID=3110540 RepID=UPI00237BF562|nr:hypothetical protein [Paenibacillus humicola]